MAELLTASDFNDLVRYFAHTAWRLETLPEYAVDAEQAEFARYQAGEALTSPLLLDWYQPWLEQIRAATAEGRRVERVRIMAEPPTDYQRWEAWCGQWNEDAGEKIGYLPRSRAVAVGLPVDEGDWWLFDSTRLARMRFDPDGRPMGGEIITDPHQVRRACSWRDVAAHHSTPFQGSIAV